MSRGIALLRLKLPWLVVAYWAAVVALTFLGMAAAEHLRSFSNSYFETALVGFLLGQIALATIIGGLMARSWVASWLVSVVLACIQTVVVTIAVHAHSWSMVVENMGAARENLALCGLWPSLLLSTCAPLIVLRGVLGWTLTREATSAIPVWRLGVEDLLQVGVIIACTMTLSQLFLVSIGPSNINETLVVMALFAAMSLVCVPAVVYVSFRSRTWSARLRGWFILSMLAFVTTLVLYAIMEGDWRQPLADLKYTLIGLPIGCITVATGITCLLASGYQLSRFEKSPPLLVGRDTALASDAGACVPSGSGRPATDSWLCEDQQPTKKSVDITKFQARFATALVVALAALSGFAVHIYNQWYVRFFQQWANSSLPGVYTRAGEVYGLHFDASFTDKELDKYLQYRNTLTHLSFSGTQITDDLLPKLTQFGRLMHLDLSNTAITEVGLQQLKLSMQMHPRYDGKSHLYYLSLADTKVSWAACVELANWMEIENLDLSGLHITDDQLTDPIPVRGLKLSRNPITDEGLARQLKVTALERLDVSDTSITGECFTLRNCPRTLILDRTQVSDTTLSKILATKKVQTISLMDTKVTAAVLPQLGGRSVRLGKCFITDNDLGNLAPIEFKHLGLNDKQFTGACLKAGNVVANSLDLSRSSVTDEILHTIACTHNPFRFLGLAHTQVTDAGMRNVLANELDLRGTRVTAGGISRGAHGNRIIVDRRQFTPQQKAGFLRNKLDIDERPVLTYGP